MRRAFVLLCIVLLASCQSLKMTSQMPWSDDRREVCQAWLEYLKDMALGNHWSCLAYEDQMLWPSLDSSQYVKLRSLHPEFLTMLSRSHIDFVECTRQKDWGIYGRTFDGAWMFTFTVTPPSDATGQEKPFADLVARKQYTSVGVRIDGKWKFLPVFGPELHEIANAMMAYESYLSVIRAGQFEKIYDFTPNMMKEGLLPADIREKWLESARQLPEVVKLANPKPYAGRIVFNTSFAGAAYPWGVYFDVVMDVDRVSQIKEQDSQTQLVVKDYKTGANSVLMVLEDGWKPVTINPLFGAPGQDR